MKELTNVWNEEGSNASLIICLLQLNLRSGDHLHEEEGLIRQFAKSHSVISIPQNTVACTCRCSLYFTSFLLVKKKTATPPAVR
jgi:hypothetical protein